MYEFGLIGNCQSSALVGRNGTIDWMCLPRPDSPPVFGAILDDKGGHFSVTGENAIKYSQEYVPNTAVLITDVECVDGSSFRITDFFPRFLQHGRAFRPTSLFRIVEPLSGHPTIRVSCCPVSGWDKQPAQATRGNSHLRWEIRGEQLRLTTNMPLTYLEDEIPFLLQEPICLALTWGGGMESDLAATSRAFLDQTVAYWNTWVKHCSIPSLFQKETIRSALTLKLHCYEDTGAILAALTTSLPEEAGGERNWDYRLCWLRDAYFVLSAFHNLGHFEEMEGFVKFLLNIAERHEHSRERLCPVYRLDQSLPTPETLHENWAGHLGSRPVRSDNQASEHVQNDVYGEMALALAPIFLDERFRALRTPEHERLLATLTRFCISNISKPDAGLWELRSGWQEHSFSNLMCWAGIDRAARIQRNGYLKGMELAGAQAKAELAVQSAAKEGALRNGPNDDSMDASLLQLVNLRFPDKKLYEGTIRAVRATLELSPGSGLLYRYNRRDDFGKPQSSFLICSFWLVQALVRTGELKAAHKAMNDALASANSLGLFAEHFYPGTGRQAGNFPQAYSHVGLINAAFALSPPWSEVL